MSKFNNYNVVTVRPPVRHAQIALRWQDGTGYASKEFDDVLQFAEFLKANPLLAEKVRYVSKNPRGWWSCHLNNGDIWRTCAGASIPVGPPTMTPRFAGVTWTTSILFFKTNGERYFYFQPGKSYDEYRKWKGIARLLSQWIPGEQSN